MRFRRMVLTLSLGMAALAGRAEPLIDRYGQFTDLDFKEKVHSDEELKSDAGADESYYRSFPIPERTFWGGLPGSKEKYGLTATGFFHLEKIAALRNREMLVDPEGNLYFHLGVCSCMPGNEFTCVKGREEIYEWLPTAANGFGAARWGDSASFYLANWIRKYGSYDPVGWQREIVRRLRAFGFNGFGEFTQVFEGNDRLGFAFTKCLEHYWKQEKFTLAAPRFIDPFDPACAPLLEKVFARRTRPYLKNPALIGYYSENEVPYREMLKALLAKREAIPAKQRFAALMKERYKGNIRRFNENWGSSFADFRELETAELKSVTPAAKEDGAAFEELFFDALFKLISETLRKVDPDHLYLGERILPSEIRNRTILRTLGRYCDIFGANYYTDGYSPESVKFMAQVSGRPLLLSEWSFGSREQGLFGVRDVKDQQERAAHYRRYVENAAAGQNVVGCQWFCLLDESNTGRGWDNFRGERFNTGFFNVCDRPYRELAEAAADANGKVYDLIEGKCRPVAAPPRRVLCAGDRRVKIGRIAGGLPLDGGKEKYSAFSVEPLYLSLLTGQNRKQKEWGSFRFGWDDRFFYCRVEMPDPSPAMNSRSREFALDDSLEIFLCREPEIPGRMLPQDCHLILPLGRNKEGKAEFFNFGRPVPARGEVLSFCRSDGKSFVAEYAVPWSVIGFSAAPGGRIGFDLIVNIGHHGRIMDRVVYNGLADDRFRRDLYAKGTLEP